MSRVKPLTSYFKKLSKDEIEIQSLKQTHSSRDTRTLSIETARTNSTLSSKLLESFIDLSQENDLPPLIDVEDSDDEEDGVPPVVAPNVGDSVFKALDTVLGPSTEFFLPIFSLLA
jgi:hypothetical protein